MPKYEVILKFRIGIAPEDNEKVRDQLFKSGVVPKHTKIAMPNVTIKGEFLGTINDFIDMISRIVNIDGIDLLQLKITSDQ